MDLFFKDWNDEMGRPELLSCMHLSLHVESYRYLFISSIFSSCGVRSVRLCVGNVVYDIPIHVRRGYPAICNAAQNVAQEQKSSSKDAFQT